MKQEEILFFLGSACVVVFAWIAFTILHNSLTSTISETTNQAIVAIQPTFDTKVIDSMRAKPVIIPLTAIQPQVPSEVIVTNNLPKQQIATQSGTIASGGATLQ